MISVEEATRRITSAFQPREDERVPIGEAAGRVLAEDAVAVFPQPPLPVSSMDGYAVRSEDIPHLPVSLRVIGAALAGKPFARSIGKQEAVRIFTGAAVPDGADAIVIQENTETSGETVIVKNDVQKGRHIRLAGLDFKKGDVLAASGKRLTARDVALVAAGDLAEVRVRRRPVIAFAATGDELSHPGEPRKPGGIVASSGYGLSALIESWGAIPRDLGIVPDNVEALAALPEKAGGADLLITLGGASVGDHDLVQRALAPKGFALDFWKIAMRPGKPLIFGRIGTLPLLGLPGNPVSTLVCAILFLRPAIAALLGEDYRPALTRARLLRPLAANDARQDYLRARLETRDGELWAEGFAVQDSSMLSVLARAGGLIVRPPHAPAADSGADVPLLRLDEL